MDLDEQDSTVRSLYMRHRSPTFSKEETQTLVNLIAKYINVINHRSCSNAASIAKETAWKNITKIFNAQGFKHQRNVDGLKMKWDNLKKAAKKVSKNLIEVNSDYDEVTNQIVAMICDTDNTTAEISVSRDVEDEDDLNSEETEDLKDDSSKWDENDVKDENKIENATLKKGSYSSYRKSTNRSSNFTPQECRLLLQCVRREKKYVFSKESSAKAIMLKHRAWSRVTHNFNRLNPQKRSTKALCNKLQNMKRLAKRKDKIILSGNNKHDDFEEFSKVDLDVDKVSAKNKIKQELAYNVQYEHDDDEEDVGEEEEEDNNYDHNGSNSFEGHDTEDHISLAPDPLSTVLNGSSGIGSINLESLNTENNEVTKLKLELLKYQLENAKLERKRIEEALQADAKLFQSRETEMALRLRAARLDAVAAAARLPPAHAALAFRAQEAQAQAYLEDCDAS